MSRRLFKSAFVVSALTLLSRISGLVRDVVFANYIGAGVSTDAFFVAFRIPNLFRRFFGEGAFSAAFVPVYAAFEPGREDPQARVFVAYCSGILGIVLLAVVVAGTLFAPLLISLIAPGFRGDPAKFQLTVDAVRFTFPYLVCISLVAMAAGVLNVRDRFAVPAVTPVLLNLSLIGAAIVLSPRAPDPALALAAGVLIAGLAQLLFQVPFLAREKMLVRPRLAGLKQSGVFEQVNKTVKLLLPAMVGASASQLNIFINTLLASFLVTGSVSWLYYADRLVEFPLALFGVAIGTVILPRLSREHALADTDAYGATLEWGLMTVIAVAIPAACGLFILSDALIATLFKYGEFKAQDVLMSSAALRGYAAGLIGLMSVKVLAPGFFARQDTRTPVKIGLAAIAVNITAALLLVGPLAHVGLALAVALGSLVNAGLLFVVLWRRGYYRPGSDFGALVCRVFGASVVMSLVLWWGSGSLEQWFSYSLIQRISNLTLWVCIGIIVYAGCLLATGLKPSTLIKNNGKN